MSSADDFFTAVSTEAALNTLDSPDRVPFQTISLDTPTGLVVFTRDGGIGTRVFADLTQTVQAEMDRLLSERAVDADLPEDQQQCPSYWVGRADTLQCLLIESMGAGTAYDILHADPADFTG